VEGAHDRRNEDDTTKPGKRAQFLDVFRSKSIPAHIEIGMKILGPFTCIYYFGGVRKTDAAPAKPGRDRFMAGLSLAVVALIIVLGFLQLGSPSNPREFRADTQRVSELYRISLDIKSYWALHASQLPSGLGELLGSSHVDPITNAPYEYHPKQGSDYELCAVFSRGVGSHVNANSWDHPPGLHCFPMDASQMPPPLAPED
jgi:hypothetical protein